LTLSVIVGIVNKSGDVQAGGVRPLIGDAVTREARAIKKETKNTNMATPTIFIILLT
jgi:hypothetical protein